jgi:hypothetical protein
MHAGFAANSATLAALASTGHVEIFSDALNHASLIDGCRLAARQGTRVHVFRHRDYAHLEQLLVASAEAVAQNGGNHACERGAEEVRASSIGHEYGPQPPEGVHRNTWHYMVVTDGVFSMDGDIADLQVWPQLIIPFVIAGCAFGWFCSVGFGPKEAGDGGLS